MCVPGLGCAAAHEEGHRLGAARPTAFLTLMPLHLCLCLPCSAYAEEASRQMFEGDEPNQPTSKRQRTESAGTGGAGSGPETEEVACAHEPQRVVEAETMEDGFRWGM